MKQIILIRHAVAHDHAEQGGDFARSLKDKGVTDAQKIGAFLQANDYLPDYILSSPAERTKQTATEIHAVLLKDKNDHPEIIPEIIYDKNLYLCGAEAYIEAARHVPGDIHSLMLVGHNPDISEFLIFLTGSETLRKPLFKKTGGEMPKAGTVILTRNADYAAPLSARSFTVQASFKPERE